jgi:poly(hydroxyalkanoate) depolymerase family esterase/deazaflavin-dependent oxidoreductase (nitroreductase family)
MNDALRLTIAGSPAEATETIRRALAIAGTWPVPSESPGETVHDTATASRPPAPTQSWRSVGAPRARPWSLQDAPGRPGSGPAARGTAEVVDTPAGGRFVERSYSNEAGSRGYKLYVPSGCAGQAVPLVVMLHGCTQDPDTSAAGTRLNELAEEGTFLVAYPRQDMAANVSRCWNWFLPAHQRRGEGEPAIIAGITQEVMTLHRVDRRRVYVAGMSAGGAMAAIMAATYPDLYAAVGVHSGVATGAAHDLRTAFVAMRRGGPKGPAPEDVVDKPSLPTIVFHGDRDTTVNPCNAPRVLDEVVPRGGLSETSSRGQVPRGREFTRLVYSGAGGDVAAECWLIHGAGHAWSGGSSAGSFTDPLGPDASREMVRFFLEHPRLPETPPAPSERRLPDGADAVHNERMAAFKKPGWLTDHVVNPLVAGITRTGLSVYGTRILAVRGRSSGEVRTTPVNLLVLDGVRYLVAPRGHTQWVRNLRAAGEGELRLGRRTEPFRASEVDDDARPPILRAYLRRWKAEVGMFFGGVGPDAPDAELRRIAPDHPVFRIDSV